MDLAATRLQHHLLVQEFETCTHEQFGPLKDRAMAHNNNVLVQAKSSTISAFEKRQLKDSIRNLFQAIEDADRRLHSTEFRFIGEPIPATKTSHKVSSNTSNSNPSNSNPSNYNSNYNSNLFNSNSNLSNSNPSNSNSSNSNPSNPNSTSLISNQTDASILLDHTFHQKHVHMNNLSGTTVLGHSRTASMNISGGTSLALNVVSEGPVMIHNVSHSLLLVRCHQLRMHGCTDCVVFAQVSNNRIVLENCRNFHIGSIRENLLCEGQFSVDDFDWPSNAPNPHYTSITSDTLLGANVEDMNAESLQEMRDKFKDAKKLP